MELNKLILASNKLSSIPGDIENLKALTILDLHDNCLECLPNEIGKLENLSKLNLNHNKLRRLPKDFFCNRNLKTLTIANNELKEISDEIGRLDAIEVLDLSHNKLNSLPTAAFGYLTCMNNFNCSNNSLKSVPDDVGFLRELTVLDLTQNDLEELPDTMSELTRLECLYLKHNNLRAMPNLRNCVHLREVHMGNNRLTEITEEQVENIPNVKILDLRDNKIAAVPDEIVNLQSLERLDLTNNDLTALPFTLGMLPHLKSLLIEGNPIKSIRRDIIARGTEGLMKYLRSRLTDQDMASLREKGNISPVAAPLPGSPPVPDKYAMKTAQSMNLSKKEIAKLPAEAIANALEAAVTACDLSKNYFTEVPNELQELVPKLYELNLSENRIEKAPPFIGLATNLQFLNLGNNKLSDLPGEVSCMTELREVALPYNRFETIPEVLYKCTKIESIIMCGNKIQAIQVADGLDKLKMLAVLDLQNNNIDHVRIVLHALFHYIAIRNILSFCRCLLNSGL